MLADAETARHVAMQVHNLDNRLQRAATGATIHKIQSLRCALWCALWCSHGNWAAAQTGGAACELLDALWAGEELLAGRRLL